MASQDHTKISLYKGQPEELSFPWISALIYVLALMLAPFISEYLFIVTFLVQVYRLLRYDIRVCSIDMAFTISFASFYRLPGGISYIVFYILLFNLAFLIKRGKLYLGAGSLLFCASVLWAAVRSCEQWDLLFFVFCGLLFLYLLHFEFQNSDYSSILWAFVFGVLFSTLYALVFRENLAVQAIVMRGTEITDERFRGLFADPNYYATFIILALVSLMCLDLHKRINRIVYYGSFAILVFGGVQTSSKSFVLMLLVIFVYNGFSIFNQKQYFKGFILLLIIALLAVWVIEGRIEMFDAVMGRFESAKNMDELTTGRTAVWGDYWALIWADTKIFLLGDGLDAPLLKYGTHNIFLEIIYNMGLVGLTLFLSFFGVLINQTKQRYAVEGKLPFLRFLPVLAILMMYFFLQGITSILFYLSLFIMYECYACCVAQPAGQS